MTFMDQTRSGYERPTASRQLAELVNWWFERQRLKRDYKKLSQMPDYLLRDVGLEHLSDLNRDIDFRHRLF